MNDNKISEVSNYLRNNISEFSAAVFDASEDKDAWIRKNWHDLENYDAWVDKYSSLDDLIATKEDNMKKVYDKYPDFESISGPRLNKILNSNDFTKEELKAYYDYRNEKNINDSRKADATLAKLIPEYDKVQRMNDDSYYNSTLANEYARKHHIEGNPNQAVVNEVAGKMAGASDFAPFPFSLAGPAIRTAQKYAADEPILTGGTALDVAGAIIPDFVEKPGKFIWNAIKNKIESFAPKVGDTKLLKQVEARFNDMDKEGNAISAAKDLNVIENMMDIDKFNDQEIIGLYESTDNPFLKAKMEEYLKEKINSRIINESKEKVIKEYGDAYANEMDDILLNSLTEKNKALYDAIHTAAKEEPRAQLNSGKSLISPFDEDGNVVPYFKDVPISDIAAYDPDKFLAPNKKADVLFNLLKLGGNKIARAGIGQRGWTVDLTLPNDNTDKDIDWVIKTYSNQWYPTEPPANYDQPLVKAAYDKWKEKEGFTWENYIKRGE